MTPILETIRLAAGERQAALVDFAQQLIRIPSLPGQEHDVAQVITREMFNLAYDEVWVDQAGNVIGKINGGPGPVIMLNGHMDHVDSGPAADWPYPPFEGLIVGDELWGRAAVDMKGPLACMIYAVSLFKQLGLTPPGDILMTVAVMEEIGGLGTQYLASQLGAQAAICGEPSRNVLRRGHRGRVGLVVTFKGRSAHASAPSLAINPHYGAAAFLSQLPTLVMAHDEALGAATLAPTLYATDQTSANVIPSEVYLTLDYRNVPGESQEAIVAQIQGLLNVCLAEEGLRDIEARAEVVAAEMTTYTGMSKLFPSVFPPFLLPDNNPLVQAAQTALKEVLGRNDGVDVWRFATDGGHLMAAGIPTIGFGPGDERLAHTNQERISLPQRGAAMVADAALLPALAEAVNREM